MTWEGSINSQPSTSAACLGWNLVSCNGVTWITALFRVVWNAAHIATIRSAWGSWFTFAVENRFRCLSCCFLWQDLTEWRSFRTTFVYNSMKMKCFVFCYMTSQYGFFVEAPRGIKTRGAFLHDSMWSFPWSSKPTVDIRIASSSPIWVDTPWYRNSVKCPPPLSS